MAILPELWRNILPRTLICCVGGALVALLAKLVNLSTLGPMETLVTASFWVAAIMTVSFRGHVGRMLLWLLFLEATLQLYQLSIYKSVFIQYPIMRIGPTVLAGVLLFTCSGSHAIQRPFLYVVWIVCNIPALLSGFAQGYLDLTENFIFYALNVLYPLVFYYAVGCMEQAEMPTHILGDIISVPILLLSAIPIALIPFELYFRQTTNFASLQFGRSYSVLGTIILAWPILIGCFSYWGFLLRSFAIALFILIFVLSFSRGGAVFFFILLAGTMIISRRQRGSLMLDIIISIAIFWGISSIFEHKFFNDALWYWLLRFNMSSNIFPGISFNLNDFFLTGRYDIWEMAITLFKKSPLWGFGIGSTPLLLTNVTYGQLSYSGMHNLFLTVLTERGLVGLFGLLVLIGRIVYLVFNSRHLLVSRFLMGFSFFIFLAFANLTGAELFLNSIGSMNATITVYLFLLIGFLEYGIGAAQSDVPSQIMPATPQLPLDCHELPPQR